MKLTTRLAVLLGTFLVLFSMLGIRLWFLQVAEGAQAAELAATQSWVTVETPAPRGDIRDRNGKQLATSRYVPAVVVDRHLITIDQRAELVQRLSALLDIPPSELDALYEEAGVNGRFEVARVDATKAYQLSEQLRELPGVRIEKVPERVYLAGRMPHVLGHLGLPTEEDLEENPDLDPNIRIGQLGVEAVYDDFLQGEPGEIAFQAKRSEVVAERPEVPPGPGSTVYLTLDLELQGILEQALVDGIGEANALKDQMRAAGKGDEAKNDVVRAAGVVLDVNTGAVLAMASIPTFEPSLFVGGVDTQTYNQLNEKQAFLNLAVSGLYPPASTFKVVTYMAALEHRIPFPEDVEGVDVANRLVNCDGRLELPGLDDGSPQIFLDWYSSLGYQFGWSDEHAALQNSCNVYFYSLALGAWRNWSGTERENVIQDQARELGYGGVTGIDLTGEAGGVIPDRELYESYKELMLEEDGAPQLLAADRLDTASPWFGGDLMNVAIGQGGVTSTPLQVALSYAALANGGQVWRPYVVGQIRNADDDVVHTGVPELVNDADLDPAHVESLLTDLNRVVTQGTASSVFAGFGDSLSQVGGKTGTGQSLQTKDNHAWFAGVTPIDDPEYAIAILLDEGGSGGAVAAPIARYVLQYLMGEELDPIVTGEQAD